MRRYVFADIEPLIGTAYEVAGEITGRYFTNVRPTLEADEESLVFISGGRQDAQALAERTRAGMVICDRSVEWHTPETADKVFVVVADPKVVFARIVNGLFVRRPPWGIHAAALVDREAKIDEKVYIGPFTYVGRAEIGSGTIIYGHVHIYDGVRIGRNVIIHAGTIIGADGFGYLRTADGSITSFPHVGGVEIEEDVEIGANTCIDRGSLSNTIVRRGAKIDNLVHIAHNVVVGGNAFVIANAMIGGSAVVGDGAWISPSATLRDRIRVGIGATVGLGAVVTKDVPDNQVWTGAPARPLEQFLEMQGKLKRL